MANTKITSRVLADNAVLTANITDANVTTAKVADNAVTGDKVADDVALAGNPTTTTQSAGNNTTRIATTAFVSTAVANLADSAPDALNTLNELAAAMGDDANFSTTITNSIAAKLPLAGGTMTGDLNTSALIHLSSADPILKFTDTAGGDAFGLFASASNYLGFYNFTDSRVDAVIDGAGNFGIGTDSPDSPLEISSSDDTRMKITDTGDSSELMLRSDGANTQIYTNTAHDLGIYTSGNVGQLHLKQSDGKVGIGTTSPSTKLHLGGTAPLDSIIRQDSTSSGTNWEIGERAAGKWQIFEDDNDSIVATFMSTGNVGIGTTSPSETLHVKRADGTALIVESSNDQNNTGDRINIEFRTDAAQGIAKIIGGKEGNYQGSSTRSGYLAFQTINANSYAERMRINSSGFTSVSNDPNYIASDQAGLQVERGGLLIHGTSLSTNFHTANHHGNYWTFIGSAGASGSYAGNFRISVPNPEGAAGTAWGGLQLEIYISGYNAKFCHAILSGYTNGGVTLSESTIIRSSGSHSISYGNYHTAGGSSNQGFYFDVDIPAYVHPAVFFRITRAGDASAGKETSMKNLKIEWS